MKTILLVSAFLLSATNALAQNYDIYVSDAGNGGAPPYKIFKYDQNGENPEVFIDDNLAWPQDILFLEDQNVVLISNLNSGLITRHNAETGEFIDVFAQVNGQPTRIKIGPDGLLYVLQWSGNGMVLRYQLDGTFVDQFTSVSVPRSIGLDWDTAGNLYVSSFNQRHVRKFNQNGNDRGLFVTTNLNGPTNIWFADNGDMLILDWSGNAIRRFDSNGNFLGNFATNIALPEGVDFFPNGNVIVGDGGAGAVKMYDSDGNFLQLLVPARSGGLLQPNAVVLRELPPEGFQINSGLNGVWRNAAAADTRIRISVPNDGPIVILRRLTLDDFMINGPTVLDNRLYRGFAAIGGWEGAIATLEITNPFSWVSYLIGNSTGAFWPLSYGTITIEFIDCNTATLHFNIPALGLEGTITIERVVAVGLENCEA